jgi:hypothetical protein
VVQTNIPEDARTRYWLTPLPRPEEPGDGEVGVVDGELGEGIAELPELPGMSDAPLPEDP